MTTSPCRRAPPTAPTGRPGRTWSTTTTMGPTRAAPRPPTHGPAPSRSWSATSTQVQVRVATDDAAPSDMKLAVIDPGQAPRSARELPAIDTAELAGEDDVEPAAVTTEGGDGLALSAATYTPKPKIYSRAQWGADERMRDKGSLHYFEVHAGFVHHTVNANDYTARAGARHPAEHLRVPHQVPRLERHRLQLPGRPVRPDLGGPVRRRRPPGGRGAHPRLQRQRVRDVGDRQLRAAPAVPGDAPGVRRAVRLEAVAARGQRRLHQAVGDQAELQGDQRAPRRRLHGVPGQVPLRQDPADPRSSPRSCRRDGAAGSSSPTSRAPTTPTSSCGARAMGWRSCSRSGPPGRRTRSGSRSGPGST